MPDEVPEIERTLRRNAVDPAESISRFESLVQDASQQAIAPTGPPTLTAERYLQDLRDRFGDGLVTWYQLNRNDDIETCIRLRHRRSIAYHEIRYDSAAGRVFVALNSHDSRVGSISMSTDGLSQATLDWLSGGTSSRRNGVDLAARDDQLEPAGQAESDSDSVSHVEHNSQVPVLSLPSPSAELDLPRRSLLRRKN